MSTYDDWQKRQEAHYKLNYENCFADIVSALRVMKCHRSDCCVPEIVKAFDITINQLEKCKTGLENRIKSGKFLDNDDGFDGD